VRLTEFWQRMDDELGRAYARSWAKDTVLSELSGRTPLDALEQGESVKDVWRAVAAHLELPAVRR
jgi:hypothetical protein